MNVMSLVYFKSFVKYIPHDDSAPESKHGWFLFTVLTGNWTACLWWYLLYWSILALGSMNTVTTELQSVLWLMNCIVSVLWISYIMCQ